MPAAVSGRLTCDGSTDNRVVLECVVKKHRDDEAEARKKVKKFIEVCMLSHKLARTLVRRWHLLKAAVVAESQSKQGIRHRAFRRSGRGGFRGTGHGELEAEDVSARA